MVYKIIIKAKFIYRPNRFIANIEIDGKLKFVMLKTQAGARSC